jgi:endonuclease-3
MDQKTASTIIELLRKEHPTAASELHFKNNFELLVAVILSAQCTDKRVNTVTEKLFLKVYTPEQFVAISSEELEKYIYSCGFYRNKAKNIKAMAKVLTEKHNGEVPSSFAELLKLPGVGRKTANVVYSVGFGGDGLPVDTHVFRVSNRLGLAVAKKPEETERQLCGLLDKKLWLQAHHYLLFHGRYTCKSQKPLCDSCTVRGYCSYVY